MSEESKAVEVEEQQVEIVSEAEEEVTPEGEDKKEDEKLGKREAAISKDVIDRAESESEEPEEEVEDCLPAFFMEEDDRHKVELDLLFDKKTGRIKSVSRKGSLRAADVPYEKFRFLTYTTEWFEFSIPGYEQLAEYKSQSSGYNIQAGRVIVDDIQRRTLILIGHLKDWSLRDRESNKIELKFGKEGELSKESALMIGKVFPTLVEVVVTLFEADVILTTA